MYPHICRGPSRKLLLCAAGSFVFSMSAVAGWADASPAGPASAAGNAVDPTAASVVRSGRVLERSEAMLTIHGEEDEDRHTFIVAADTQVTLDGTAAKLADLQPGHFVKVTADRAGDKSVATMIEAVSREEKPDTDDADEDRQAPPHQEADAGALEVVPEVFEGRVLMAGTEHLAVAVNGDHEMFTVGPNAEILKDGQPVMLADLSKQDVVRITAERDGENLVVLRIEARSSH